MTWRILVADPLHPQGVNLLEAEAEVFTGGDLTPLGSVDALIVRSATRVTAEVLDRGQPQLKVVGRAGVGVDNIDLDAARRHGVIVVNAPQSVTFAVAELALGLMLALARHVPAATASMRQGVWNKKALKGSELAGKTLGIVGTGRIGAALAERARALGMTVVGYDSLVPPDQIAALGIEPVDFETLLARTEYLSLHVPLTDETRGMIGAAQLSQLPAGARVISTARGGVVDEAALLEALDSGHLAGAALDVFEQEPPGATELILHPNVITTPHLGAQTEEAQIRAATDIAEEVLAALRGEQLRWRVA